MLTIVDGVDRIHRGQVQVAGAGQARIVLRLPLQLERVRLVQDVHKHARGRIRVLVRQLRHQVRPLRARKLPCLMLCFMPEVMCVLCVLALKALPATPRAALGLNTSTGKRQAFLLFAPHETG